jgi:hypothetical protein
MFPENKASGVNRNTKQTKQSRAGSSGSVYLRLAVDLLNVRPGPSRVVRWRAEKGKQVAFSDRLSRSVILRRRDLPDGARITKAVTRCVISPAGPVARAEKVSEKAAGA